MYTSRTHRTISMPMVGQQMYGRQRQPKNSARHTYPCLGKFSSYPANTTMLSQHSDNVVQKFW